MTLFLIIALIAIGISLYQSGDRAQKKNYEKGKFNLDLQKKLYVEFYQKTIDDIEQMFSNPESDYRRLFDDGKQEYNPETYYCSNLFNFLKTKFGLPLKDSEIYNSFYHNKLQSYKTKLEYFRREKTDESPEIFYGENKNGDIINKITLGRKNIPPCDIDVLFSTPNNKIAIPEKYWTYYGLKKESFTTYNSLHSWQMWEYDEVGCLKIAEVCLPIEELFDIVSLRTRKEMFKQGYEFVGAFETNPLKQKRIRVKGTPEQIKKYPWYYGTDFIWY
ncbi:MAG: hypothetical protein ACI4M6_05360 [Christensenellaceae bacterium]